MKNQSFDYAAKTAELEAIVASLQSSDVSLDEALKLHEKGQKLVAEIEDFLKTAEVEITKRTVAEE